MVSDLYPNQIWRSWLIKIGLKLEGADWKDDQLVLNDGQTTHLKACYLTWRKIGSGNSGNKTSVNLPVYLNSDRSKVLFSVNLESEKDAAAQIAQRGVCLIAL